MKLVNTITDRRVLLSHVKLYSSVVDTKKGLDVIWTSHLSCSIRTLSCSIAGNIPVQKTPQSQWLSPRTNPWEYHQRWETYDKYKFNAVAFWVLYSFRHKCYIRFCTVWKIIWSLHTVCKLVWKHFWCGWAHLYFCHSGFSSYKKSPRLEWTSSGREHSFLQKKI